MIMLVIPLQRTIDQRRNNERYERTLVFNKPDTLEANSGLKRQFTGRDLGCDVVVSQPPQTD
jgi:hypothetical protein